MKKYLFIVLLVFFWSCEEDAADNQMEANEENPPMVTVQSNFNGAFIELDGEPTG